MASIIEGFEYDIFISYRQKDNKGDRWVTEFVNALKSELDATFKEDISIYFDENPHDGLLETHDVDESLREKLKCLIFIPIISQTYCDPKSFAWTNEFLAFKKTANEDLFGLKIKLQNGNVASRVLPVRIHDLDDQDKAILQSELGPIRSIDFVFKSAGVNRPLRAKDDETKEITHSIFYRDQINKVANAIKEILASLKTPAEKPGFENATTSTVWPAYAKKNAIVAGVLLAIGISVFGLFYFRGVNEKTSHPPNAIAVLPFDNLSNDPNEDYFCDGTTEQVISSLARLKDIKVIARTSVQQYKKTTKSISQIGKELNVTHVLESSVRKSGNQIRITAQLIAVKDETHLWSEDFDNKVVADIFQIQDAVATKIAASLKKELLPNEQESLKTEKTSNPEAYEHYLKGEYMHGIFFDKFENKDFLRAEAELKKAIELDTNYATARAALSNLYDTRSNVSTSDLEKDQYRKLNSKFAAEAYHKNPRLPYSLIVQYQSWIHKKNLTDADLDSAFKFSHGAFDASPNKALFCSEFGGFYSGIGLYQNALTLFKRAKDIDPTGANRFAVLSWGYFFLRDLKTAEENAKISLELKPDYFLAHMLLFSVYTDQKKFREAEEALDNMKKINPERDLSEFQAKLLAAKGEKEKSLSTHINPDSYFILKMKDESLDKLERDPVNYLDFKNPYFDFLRNDDRFKKIEEKAKNVYELRIKKYGNIDLPKE